MNSFNSGGILLKIDVRKAFDEIDRKAAMIKILNSVGQYKFLFKVKNIYENTKLRIITDFGVSKWIDAYQGIVQGYRTSPGIFVRAIDDIIVKLNSTSECILKAYADDIIIIGPRNKAVIKRVVSELGRMLNDVSLKISEDEDKLQWIRFGG
jgi:hypothetical protein